MCPATGLNREGLNREGRLIERGLNREGRLINRAFNNKIWSICNETYSQF